MKKGLLTFVIIFIATIILIFGYFYYSKKTEVIKIGVVLPLTGPTAKYGIWTKEGMELAEAEINKQNKEIQIKLLFEDDEGNPQGGVSAFYKLIKIDKVPVISGAILSQIALAISPIAEKNKIVLLSVGASSDKIKYAGDYVFRVRESSDPHGQKAAEYAFSISKYAGVILLNEENGISYAMNFKKYYEQMGGTIQLWEKYDAGETDFRSYLLKGKNKSLKVIYIPGLIPEIAILLKQAKELGLTTTFISSVGAQNPKLFNIAGQAADGLVYTYPYFDVSLAKKGGNVKKFINNYINRYNHDPDFLAANGYDAIKVLAQVITKMGYKAYSIKNGMYNIKKFPGVSGTFSFDKYGEVTKAVILKIVVNGEFKIYRE